MPAPSTRAPPRRSMRQWVQGGWSWRRSRCGRVRFFPPQRSASGWLESEAASATAALVHNQSQARGMTGELLEIGVFEWKYFLVLALSAQPGERVVALDIVGTQAPRIEHSAHGDLERFL